MPMRNQSPWFSQAEDGGYGNKHRGQEYQCERATPTCVHLAKSRPSQHERKLLRSRVVGRRGAFSRGRSAGVEIFLLAAVLHQAILFQMLAVPFAGSSAHDLVQLAAALDVVAEQSSSRSLENGRLVRKEPPPVELQVSGEEELRIEQDAEFVSTTTASEEDEHQVSSYRHVPSRTRTSSSGSPSPAPASSVKVNSSSSTSKVQLRVATSRKNGTANNSTTTDQYETRATAEEAVPRT
ncbi:unnamed protein product [Amoebophrya sp. A120]|nr:unnamed protein product [Amoebophrya sp. A120]|eukprot:GSA120T00014899001.1